MSDLSRSLPLSNQPKVDESQVSSNRQRQLADVVDLAAGLATSAGGLQFLRDAKLWKEFGAGAGAGTDDDLRGVALKIREGGARRIRSLSDAVRALLILAGSRAVDLSPTTSGSVALYAATTTSFDRRAVVSGHALRATDAEWEFGRGPLLVGTAREILEFLLGLSDIAPRRGSRE